MIQQYLKLDAAKEDVLDKLLDFESLPIWWPGLERVTIVSSSAPNTTVIDVTFRLMIKIDMRVEFVCQGHVISFRQLKGWFKRYEGDWTILPASDGTSTTLKVTLWPECSVLMPKSMIHTKLSENLSDFSAGLKAQLTPINRLETARTPLLTPPTSSPMSAIAHTPTAAKKLMHIFQTPDGLEIWLAGKRHVLTSAK